MLLSDTGSCTTLTDNALTALALALQKILRAQVDHEHTPALQYQYIQHTQQSTVHCTSNSNNILRILAMASLAQPKFKLNLKSHDSWSMDHGITMP
jgi:hypothetical protein